VTGGPRAGLSIGEFSRITHLSIRQLRRYHDGGLLVPDEVDPVSGYRYYSLDQVPAALSIHRFRELGLPVAEVRELLTASDRERRDAVLAGHLERLEEQLDRTRSAISALHRILAPGPGPEVTYRRTSPIEVAAVRATVDHDAVLEWYADAMAALAPVSRTGPPGGLYDHELFTDGRGEATVYVPTDDLPTGQSVQQLVLPARQVAVLVHTGPHDDIDVSYATLGSHVAEHGVGTDGPVQEVYLVGPSDNPDPASWRTELAWPVLTPA